MFFEFKSISNFSMFGLLANSILPFASCLAKGTNNNDAKKQYNKNYNQYCVKLIFNRL